ncbi:MAG: hypothetical protein AAFQ89_17845 [Cyanobacteria bacterium J06626_18]
MMTRAGLWAINAAVEGVHAWNGHKQVVSLTTSNSLKCAYLRLTGAAKVERDRL